MIDKFKNELKNRGQSLKWFYLKFVKEKTGLTYAGFAGQLNGYSPVNDDVKEEIKKYINNNNEISYGNHKLY